MKINIADFSKTHVLVALYNNAKPLDSRLTSVFKLSQRMTGERPRVNQFPSPFMPSEEQLKIIQRDMESRQYISEVLDIGCGPKLLGVDLSGSEFDSAMYDSFNGDNSAQVAVAALKVSVVFLGLFTTIFFSNKPKERTSENIQDTNELRPKI